MTIDSIIGREVYIYLEVVMEILLNENDSDNDMSHVTLEVIEQYIPHLPDHLTI